MSGPWKNYGKCKDCGGERKELNSIRVCGDCWSLRMRFIQKAHAGGIQADEFRKVQRTIANSHGSGRGAAAMRRAIGEDAPVI